MISFKNRENRYLQSCFDGWITWLDKMLVCYLQRVICKWLSTKRQQVHLKVVNNFLICKSLNVYKSLKVMFGIKTKYESDFYWINILLFLLSCKSDTIALIDMALENYLHTDLKITNWQIHIVISCPKNSTVPYFSNWFEIRILVIHVKLTFMHIGFYENG